MVELRSATRPDGPVSVAHLLRREGLEPEPTVPRPVNSRLRRTLIAVGSVVAAGSVLGGAIAVGTAGDDSSLPTPRGPSDQITSGPTTPGEYPSRPAPDAADRPDPAAPIPDARIPVQRTPAPAAAPAPPVAVPEPATPSRPAAGFDGTDPKPAGGDVASRPSEADAAAEPAPDRAAAQPSPSPAPTTTARGPVSGLLGEVGDTVGSLLDG